MAEGDRLVGMVAGIENGRVLERSRAALLS
jgi:hypothetical protein